MPYLRSRNENAVDSIIKCRFLLNYGANTLSYSGLFRALAYVFLCIWENYPEVFSWFLENKIKPIISIKKLKIKLGNKKENKL